MNEQKKDDVRAAVREQYGNVARTSGAVGCAPGCCGPGANASLALGYAPEDLAAVPEGANMGLGCGNPQAIAALATGETVLDLGAGGGFDCFLAAQAGRADGAGHRRRHDAGDGREGARERAEARRRRTSSSGSARSSTCPSPTTASTSSSRTA